MNDFRGNPLPHTAGVFEDTSLSWSRVKLGWFPHFLGLSSLFAAFFSSSYIFDSIKLLIVGSIIETGRRICQWLLERYRFQYSITAQFSQGDPTYEWIVHFLTQERVWRRSREFKVSASNSERKWAIETGPNEVMKGTNADYVPTYQVPHLFRWKGYWLDIQRSKSLAQSSTIFETSQNVARIILTIYTSDMSVLSKLVEEARLRYIEVSKPDVIVHMVDTMNHSPQYAWSISKRKVRRPLSSIILQQGVIQSLVEDAQEFFDTENWYVDRGIPHRRGYLLHGPPGSGKTSTIYALASELGLEIYSLSLSSGGMSDAYLQRAASSIPKRSIFLIEDIDCAFPSREEESENEQMNVMNYRHMLTPPFLSPRRQSSITLSGLLNVIDGVGSEEGKLFFATTNYVDRLDPALLRPGRIDKKIQYSLATKDQAAALFLRFFPETSTPSSSINTDKDKPIVSASAAGTLDPGSQSMQELSKVFASSIPADEFSTAELQGYLLGCKKQPEQAVSGVEAWVDQERKDRVERKAREEASKRKAMVARNSNARVPVHPSPPSTSVSSGVPQSLPPPNAVGGPIMPPPAVKAIQP